MHKEVTLDRFEKGKRSWVSYFNEAFGVEFDEEIDLKPCGLTSMDARSKESKIKDIETLALESEYQQNGKPRYREIFKELKIPFCTGYKYVREIEGEA